MDARDQTADPCMVKVAGTAEAVKKVPAVAARSKKNEGSSI